MNIPKPLIMVLNALPWIAAIAALFALFALRYPPDGTLRVTSAMDGKSPWIFPFLPSERVSKPGTQPEGWIGQRITADPVYASARIPGPYDSAEIHLEYRVDKQPLLELGIAQGSDPSATMIPLYSAELASENWQHVSSGNEQGFVRSGTPATRLEQSSPSGIAVWDATATMPLLSDPATDATSTAISLRGSHDFYVVPAGGAIDVTLAWQVANRKAGSDVIAFHVYRGDDEIPDQAYAIQLSNEMQMGTLQHRRIHIDHADPGVYRIAVAAPDDVFIRNVETTSQHWVVGPRLYAGDTVGYLATPTPLRVWTNSRHVVAETFHKEGFQTIQFGALSSAISRTHQTTRLDRSDAASIVELSAPRGDLRCVLDGYVAFRPEAFFEPRPKRFTDATRVDPEQLVAIVTSYQPPQMLADGWASSTVRIPLSPQADTLKMTLSAPGLLSRAGSVDMRNITIVYHRPAGTWREWMQTLRQELANAWHRL